ISAQWDISASHVGYWPSNPSDLAPRRVTIFPNQISPADFVLVPICTGTLTITVIDKGRRAPIPNLFLQATNRDGGPAPAATDSSGVVTFLDAPLGYNNSQTTYDIAYTSSGGPSSYQPAVTRAGLVHCGDGVSATLELAPVQVLPTATPTPTHNFADVQGHAFDLDTGAPIAGVFVF